MVRACQLLIVISLGLMSCKQKTTFVEVRNESGNVAERYTEILETKEKSGPYEKYDANGVVIEKGEYLGGEPHGERVVYYQDGETVNIRENYADGAFNGQYQYFYKDGTLEFEGTYTQGAMNGDWKQYYASGQLKEIVRFENNEENGPFTEYHENGQLKAEGQYLSGDNENGLLKLYNEAGVLERKMECDSGWCETIWTLASEK